MDIGGNIRAIRKRKGITIPQLCEGTGLSKGFVSNIENNKTSPSIATLDAIAKFLNVPLTYFLMEKKDGLKVIRAAERRVKSSHEGQNKIEYLTTSGPLRLMIAEMAPGTHTDLDHAHEGKEVHHVLKGVIYAEQAEESATLEAGDTFSWNASIPHFVKNVGDEPAVLIIAIYTENEENIL